jgi:hypothetical protein
MRWKYRLHPAFKAKPLGQDKVGAGDISGLRLVAPSPEDG